MPKALQSGDNCNARSMDLPYSFGNPLADKNDYDLFGYFRNNKAINLMLKKTMGFKPQVDALPAQTVW